jgi:hypothetical protein
LVSITLQPLYPQGKSPGTFGIGCWVGLRFGLDAVEKRKKFFVTAGNGIPVPLPFVLWPVAIFTSLSGLSKSTSFN